MKPGDLIGGREKSRSSFLEGFKISLIEEMRLALSYPSPPLIESDSVAENDRFRRGGDKNDAGDREDWRSGAPAAIEFSGGKRFSSLREFRMVRCDGCDWCDAGVD